MEYEHKQVAVGTTVTKAFLPLRTTIIAVAKVLQEQDVYGMSQDQFISAVIKASGGAASPHYIKSILADLRREAF